MTIKDIEADIERLAQIAVSQSWTDRLIRESCTVSGERFQHFLPRKYSLLKKAIRAIESGQAKIASEYN